MLNVANLVMNHSADNKRKWCNSTSPHYYSKGTRFKPRPGYQLP